MDYKKIVVAGAGVLGAQIGYQAAFKGYDVTFWLRSAASIDRAEPRLERLHKIYLQELEDHKALIGQEHAAYALGLIDDFENLTVEKLDELKAQATNAYENRKYELDIAKAVNDADLVIESVSEVKEDKIEFFQKMAPVLDEKTVIVTNSSTLLPGMFAQASGRPEKFLSLHFANTIWRNNLTEIMVHAGTAPQYSQELKAFAESIGMIPVIVQKEQPGYFLNSLLVPLLKAAEELWANEVGTPEDIDKAWRIGTGAPNGPFEILDIVGLMTPYNISSADPRSKDPSTVQFKIKTMLKEMIDAGKLGRNAGEGFYKYDK